MPTANRLKANQATVAAQVPPHLRVPHRLSITLNWGSYQALQSRSDEEGRSLSNLAAHLLERALRP